MASKMNDCPFTFEKMAKSRVGTTVPIVCVLIVALLLLVLTVLQSFVVEEDGGLTNCEDTFTSLLQPIHYKIKGDNDSVGCPWRVRNTAFRSIVVSIAVIASIAAIVILAKPNQKLWIVIWWTYWLLFVFMFIVFILDCDGINNGFQFCINEYTDIVEAFGGEMEACYVTPWVWTAIIDFILSVLCYYVYGISKYYIVDDDKRRMSIQNTKNTNNNNNINNTATTTTEATTTGATETVVTQPSAPKKEDSPDPFAEYQGGYEVNDGNDTNAGNTGNAFAISSAYDE